MAKQYPALDKTLRAFIAKQKIFFVGSAAAGSRVNISPKDGGSLRILGDNEVCYLDQTGSGNETSAHSLADGRITIMFCAFEGLPNILRLYGQSQIVLRGTAEYARLLADQFDGQEPPGARQIVINRFDLVQTSCGYAVPLFDYVADRPNLQVWAAHQGEDGMDEYRRQKNAVSIDGLPTGMFPLPDAAE